MEKSRLTRDGTAKPVSRDQILRRERGQGSIHFPSSADHGQGGQPYSVDLYSCYMCDHTYLHSVELLCFNKTTQKNTKTVTCRASSEVVELQLASIYVLAQGICLILPFI